MGTVSVMMRLLHMDENIDFDLDAALPSIVNRMMQSFFYFLLNAALYL